MFKKGQVVNWEGLRLVVDVVGGDLSDGSVVLCLRYPCVIGAPIQEFATIPPVIVKAHEVVLIGNNYRAKSKCSR